MPLPLSERRISVKSQESRPKKIRAILAVLTSFFAISAAFSRFSPLFESKIMLSDRARSARSENFHPGGQMSCRVATFARDPGPFTSCHVVTNAWDLELKDKDKCQKSRTNLAHPKGHPSQGEPGTIHGANRAPPGTNPACHRI